MARIGRRWREVAVWVVLLAVLVACGQPRYATPGPHPVSTTTARYFAANQISSTGTALATGAVAYTV